jgi:hypothetical protein
MALVGKAVTDLPLDHVSCGLQCVSICLGAADGFNLKYDCRPRLQCFGEETAAAFPKDTAAFLEDSQN